jgi:hypothetical protein
VGSEPGKNHEFATKQANSEHGETHEFTIKFRNFKNTTGNTDLLGHNTKLAVKPAKIMNLQSNFANLKTSVGNTDLVY